MSFPFTMSSTPQVLQPTSLTYHPWRYVAKILLKAHLSRAKTVQKVTGYLPADDGLKKTLTGADVVVIPAGIPRMYALSHTLETLS